jgi:hypothetical protein
MAGPIKSRNNWHTGGTLSTSFLAWHTMNVLHFLAIAALPRVSLGSSWETLQTRFASGEKRLGSNGSLSLRAQLEGSSKCSSRVWAALVQDGKVQSLEPANFWCLKQRGSGDSAFLDQHSTASLIHNSLGMTCAGDTTLHDATRRRNGFFHDIFNCAHRTSESLALKECKCLAAGGVSQ